MAGITLAIATAKLTLWLAADDALATSQSYSIEGRTLTRADGQLISDNIDRWNKRVIGLGGGGMRSRAITPVMS